MGLHSAALRAVDPWPICPCPRKGIAALHTLFRRDFGVLEVAVCKSDCRPRAVEADREHLAHPYPQDFASEGFSVEAHGTGRHVPSDAIPEPLTDPSRLE